MYRGKIRSCTPVCNALDRRFVAENSASGYTTLLGLIPRNSVMAEPLKIRVRDCISHLTSDIASDARMDVVKVDALVNRSINAVTDSLAVIRQVQDPERKAMLMRLYPEYQFLCGFVHFSLAATVLSGLLDPRNPHAAMVSSINKNDVFQKELAGPAIWLDSISIVQGCSEFVSVYRDDIELARAAIEGWKSVMEQSLIGRVIWQLRARRLLGALS